MAQDTAGTADGVSVQACLDLLDTVLDAVLVIAPDRTVVFANLAAEQVFGRPPGELAGKGVEVLAPPGGQPRHGALRQRQAADPDPRPRGGRDLGGVRRDGSGFPAEVSLATTVTPAGPLLIADVRDLTLQRDQARAELIQHDLERRLRASDERFRLAFDAAPVGMLMISARPDHVGEVVKVNRALCELMGRSDADLLGQQAVDVFLAERPGDVVNVQDRLLAGDIICADSLERRVVHADGHDIWVEISVALVRNEAGKPDYFFVPHVVDVTAQREARIEAGRRAEQDHRIAAVLQEALLPNVPRRVGLTDVAARYEPAAGAAVGGDWLDVFTLPDGRVGVTVGDVAGHGITSASTMSRLRYALRALANTGAGPAEVVSRLNQAMHLSELTSPDIEIATVVHAQFDPRTGVLRHCSAGHLPLVCLCPGSLEAAGGASGQWPGGVLRLLPSSSGPPIGVVPDARYDEYREVFEPGSLLIGYTDGLVERRAHALDEGLARLVQDLCQGLAALAPFTGQPDVELVADAVLAAAPPGRREDDTAVVVLTLPGDRGPETVTVDLPPRGGGALASPAMIRSLGRGQALPARVRTDSA